MMKKPVLLAGILFALILLMLCTSASAQTEEPQPSKSAAQWKSEGAVVLSDSDDPGNFIVLRKDICYLKEKAPGGKPGNGNQFTLSEYDVVQPQNSVNGQDAYCVEAGGKLYFGVRDAGASDGNTLVLKQDQMLITDGITPQTAIAAAPFTLGAWIDWDPSFKVDDFKIKEIPFYFYGDVHVFLDHWSDSSENTTHHTIQYYVQLNMTDMGFEADTPTTTDDAHVCIFSYRHVDILWLSAKLEKFLGKLGVGFSIHDGLKLYFDTWGVIPTGDISMEEDGPYWDSEVSTTACSGDADIGFEVGVGGDFKPLIQEESITVGFGLSVEGKKNDQRFIPDDTKEKWHSCDECWLEDIRCRVGPLNVVMDIWGFDPWTWSSEDKKFDPFHYWCYSKTWNDSEDGNECLHCSYRLDTTVQNRNGVALPNVNIAWDTESPYKPHASGTTNSMGITSIYVEPQADRVITAEIASPADPSQIIMQKQKIDKDIRPEQMTFTLDIPEKWVYFRNADTGEATNWPADMTFIPFYCEDVTLPNTVPNLSGRVFTGWNTKEDGSGTSYAPGTKLTLKDDITLWAQWKIAGDQWYVVYNANGGTKAPGPQEIQKGKDAVLTRELPESRRMIFKGWTPDLRKMDPVYQPGDKLKYDSQKNYVVLYAIWNLSPVPKPIHVSFDANGVKEAVLPADVWFEQSSWLQLEPAHADLGSGWAFIGWSENPKATTPEFPAGRSYYFYRDVMLYAIWEKQETITLTFRDSILGPVSGIPDPISIVPSMSRNVKIPNTRPTRSRMLFTGWNTARDGSGINYAPGSVITLTENTTLWAQWKTLPPTGDAGHPVLWLSMILLGFAGFMLPKLLRKAGKRKE